MPKLPNPPNPPYRIFISVPWSSNLTPQRDAIKQKIIELVRGKGFEPFVGGEMGFDLSKTWSFERVKQLMQKCQGVIIIGVAREEFIFQNQPTLRFITEWSQCEGAIAEILNLPTLVIREDGVMQRGVMSTQTGESLVLMPPNADVRWFSSANFMQSFNDWEEKVSNRHHVFLGYSSGARPTAKKIMKLFKRSDVRILDWWDFSKGGTVLDEIKRAEATCMGGIFLFTKDDEIRSKGKKSATPRDNVIFEAGYFMNTKGNERTLLICEEGVKIPADVGGNIYLPLKDRHDISTIEDDLRKFIEDRF